MCIFSHNTCDIFMKYSSTRLKATAARAGPMPNEKRSKFVELAEARVNRTLKELQLIGNLSNRSAYEFSDADVRRIFSALQKGLQTARSRFSKQSERAGGEFRLQ